MNKELIKNNTKKKFSGELLDIVLNQIDNYFKLAESNYKVENKYHIGDEVILNKNHLLHGIGKHINLINIFAERGIVSQDYFDEESNHAFWSVDKEIPLKDFIKNYSGMVANHNDIYEQVPYGMLDNFVEKN